MKIQQRLVAILTAAFILSGCFPMPAVTADEQPEDTIAAQDNTAAHDGNTSEETQLSESAAETEEDPDETSQAESGAETTEDTEHTDKASQSDPAVETTEDTDDTDKASQSDPAVETTENTDDTDKASQSESAAETTEDTDDTDKASQSMSEIETEAEEETEIAEETEGKTAYPVPDEPPEFHARISYNASDYWVIGTFTDLTPDIVSIDTWYSLDGKNWNPAVSGDWNLRNLGTDDRDQLNGLQSQRCLYGFYEPLKSYRAGEIDRFYVKLRITKENGQSYETQSAVIKRGDLQPLPEEMTATALFSRSIRITERSPYRQYGKYQLTISADATDADVSALLPDTLPVEVQLAIGSNFFADCTIDCPVTWKPLSLPPLTAGESITIPDAAEKIMVPKGTVLQTPFGAFQLDRPLRLETNMDEVRLVLNVCHEDRNPTGGLRQDRDGLYIALKQKPTSAAFIHAYVLTEGESEWTELTGLELAKELNAHYSNESSGYTLVLYNDQEPYKSHLAAIDAGETPTPFFVGLTIEGGIYDGKQLILAWPDDYEQLPNLPKIGGFGGNEGNAGANNNDDSTENGQRPNLPQTPDDKQEEQQPDLSHTPSDGQLANLSLTPDEGKGGQQTDPDQPSDDNGLDQPETEPVNLENQNILSWSEEDNDISIQQPDPDSQKPEITESGQRPNLPQTAQDTSDTPYAGGSTAAGQMDSLIVELFDSPAQSPVKVQAATEKTDDSAKITPGHTADNDSRIPLLPVTVTAAAGICIGAAVCRMTGFGLFCQIAGKIRNILHK